MFVVFLALNFVIRNFHIVPVPRTVCYSAQDSMWELLLLSLWALCAFISVLKSALTRSLHRMPQKTQSLSCLRQCTMYSYIFRAIFLSCSYFCIIQCCGSVSGSVGSLCFWASRIRIRHYLYGSGSFHQQGKKVRKTLIFTNLWILFDFSSLKNKVNVPSKSNKKITLIKNLFLLASCQPLTKKAGSGTGSVSQWYGSADLDPNLYQNVTDPQHYNILVLARNVPVYLVLFGLVSHSLFTFFLSLTPYSSFFGLDTAFLVIFLSFFLHVSFPPACSVVPTVPPTK